MTFDEKNVDYLTSHFSLEQLKEEAHQADVNIGEASCFGDDEDYCYRKKFGKVCELALNIK